jgi:hypothetical protein
MLGDCLKVVSQFLFFVFRIGNSRLRDLKKREFIKGENEMLQKLTSAYVKNKKIVGITQGQFVVKDEYLTEKNYEDVIETFGKGFKNEDSISINLENGLHFNVFSVNNVKLGLTVDYANDLGDLLPLEDMIGKTIKTFRLIEDDRFYIKFSDETVLEVSLGYSHEEIGALEWSITYNGSVYADVEMFKQQRVLA